MWELGEKWGHLEVVGVELEQRVLELESGSESWKEEQATLKCSCGGEVRVWKSEWKGKRRIRDCGCGISALDGNVIVVTVSMRLKMKVEIQKYAIRENLRFSHALVELVRKGLATEGVEVFVALK